MASVKHVTTYSKLVFFKVFKLLSMCTKFQFNQYSIAFFSQKKKQKRKQLNKNNFGRYNFNPHPPITPSPPSAITR